MSPAWRGFNSRDRTKLTGATSDQDVGLSFFEHIFAVFKLHGQLKATSASGQQLPVLDKCSLKCRHHSSLFICNPNMSGILNIDTFSINHNTILYSPSKLYPSSFDVTNKIQNNYISHLWKHDDISLWKKK